VNIIALKMPKMPENRQKTPILPENGQKTPILPENDIKSPILSENTPPGTPTLQSNLIRPSERRRDVSFKI